MAITVATGGSALPIIASVAIGTAVTAGMNAGVTAIKGGSGEDILNSALDGASDGFMWSGIFAFGGATINAIKASGQGASLAATSNVNATTSKTVSLRGTQNPKIKAAAARGRERHKTFDYGTEVVREVRVPGGRVDAIDFANKILFELKPNNPAAIAKGKAQLTRYLKHFPDFIGKIRTY